MSKSKIEWCTDTWNPIYGCTPMSPGCENCYAKGWHDRFKGGDFSIRKADDKKFIEPLRVRKPKRYFVGAMTDLFHEDVPEKWLDLIFTIMGLTYKGTGTDENNVLINYKQKHQYMILTKRPERMKKYIDELLSLDYDGFMKRFHRFAKDATSISKGYFILPHLNSFFSVLKWFDDGFPGLWLGVTAENQEMADQRIPILLRTPAAHRFVSVEPMLGKVRLDNIRFSLYGSDSMDFFPFTGHVYIDNQLVLEGNKLDWVICGGESGRNARPIEKEWVLDLMSQCKEAEVPFFFKQWGEFDELGERVGKKKAGRLLDGVEVMEYPKGMEG